MLTSSITSITGLRIECTNVLMNESVLNYYILNVYSVVDIELIVLILFLYYHTLVTVVMIIIADAIVVCVCVHKLQLYISYKCITFLLYQILCVLGKK